MNQQNSPNQDYQDLNPMDQDHVNLNHVNLNHADQDLLWTVKEEKLLQSTPVFDLISRTSVSAEGLSGNYYALRTSDWVVTIPVLGDHFLMVKQWRHGLGALTLEFPGGLSDSTHSPEENAARELTEETGMIAGKLTHLASFNPNPALFTNQLHLFLAEDLKDSGKQSLDADEFLHVHQVPIQEVIDNLGTGEYVHAFLGTAIGLYLRHLAKKTAP